ncbi:MAG: glycosyltransferase [Phenylobacterium sp.]|uniref:glycosyltransferase n=1 Tax=Phenylobacterium sp. TaxID=1871053 RepID=UPI0025D1B45A|nr:glycosyltransferase [Phenylobacterium sp.]MBA4010696.1 glycosyltransferase [Phenylobacterium sp.]
MADELNIQSGDGDDWRRVAESGLFDDVHYRLSWPDLAPEADAIEHYLLCGWESSNPGLGFDGLYYLASNPDVRAAGLNPLLHYLLMGRSEGRRAIPPARREAEGLELVGQPSAPSAADWRALAAERDADPRTPVVDVVVPIFRNLDQTMRCLFSVLRSPHRTPFRLIAIDDCSPEPDLSAALTQLAAKGLIELHRPPQNLGFVGACNLAMSLHEDRDVVLLNSDTEVFGDWLDRLKTAAYGRTQIGTVTPLSNNAEICSYPHFVQDNCWKLELSDAELDALAAEVNAGELLPIPTGVGFCLYIRRDCLNQVGLFDEENFGKGYGEENDFCRRAAAGGWLSVLAPNIFVRHYGGSSFGDSKNARVSAAIQTVECLHPGYNKLVGDFVRSDPASAYRTALDMARAAKLLTSRPRGAVLFITHNWGGGAERHVQDMCRLTAQAGAMPLIGRPSPSDPEAIVLEVFGNAEFPNLPTLHAGGPLGLAAAHLGALGVSHVHVHSLAGYSDQVSDFVASLPSEAGASYDVTLHDYMAVCPRITMIDRSSLYCGEPDLSACESCIAHAGSPFGRPDVSEWRARHGRLLRKARKVFVPSEDAARRMSRYLPGLEFSVRPHPEVPPPNHRGVRPADGDRRRVALLGALWPHKGSMLLAEVVRAARAHDLPLDFVLVGYSDRDAELRSLGVEVTGPYGEGDGARLLNEVNADIVWFASVWPETYSYTLSDAMAAGRMPVAFDFGAIADRIRQAEFGHVMPIDLLLDPVGVAVTLAGLRTPTSRGPEFTAAKYPDVFADYYELD